MAVLRLTTSRLAAILLGCGLAAVALVAVSRAPEGQLRVKVALPSCQRLVVTPADVAGHGASYALTGSPATVTYAPLTYGVYRVTLEFRGGGRIATAFYHYDVRQLLLEEISFVPEPGGAMIHVTHRHNRRKIMAERVVRIGEGMENAPVRLGWI
jgi:hypothetical protein